MIILEADVDIDNPHHRQHGIFFDHLETPKIIAFFERGLNTMSPPDPELLKVLDDMKGMK